jgi:hypothetical protein
LIQDELWKSITTSDADRLGLNTPGALSALAVTAQTAAEVSAAHNLSERTTYALELAIDESAPKNPHHRFNEIFAVPSLSCFWMIMRIEW